MRTVTRQRLRLSGGTELSFITAVEASRPAVLLLHGFPSGAHTFRGVVPELSKAAYVIAPDLPGFGESDVLPEPSFSTFGRAISELLDRLAIGPRYIYLHDSGAPVGFHIAMQAGVPVQGVCLYPIVDFPGWENDRHCENGLWGYADETGHRAVHEPMARELRRQVERLKGGTR